MDGDERLINLFRTCIVKVSASKKQGTGFFVAPGFILTCAHVVGDVQTAQISWQGQPFSAQVQAAHAEIHPTLGFSYPDLALLRVEQLENHPCVWLDESISLDDPLYSFGYPDKSPSGDSTTFLNEGWTGEQSLLLRLKAGQGRPGQSGAPLLNRRTRMVCGILKRSLNPESNLGARAIPVKAIFQVFPDLLVQQKALHSCDLHWYSNIPFPSIASSMSVSSSKTIYHTAAIRKLLREALSDQELEDLCMDYFPDVHNQFSLGMDKHQKTHHLLEYCSRRNQLPYLLELIYQINPERYTEYRNILF